MAWGHLSPGTWDRLTSSHGKLWLARHSDYIGLGSAGFERSAHRVVVEVEASLGDAESCKGQSQHTEAEVDIKKKRMVDVEIGVIRGLAPLTCDPPGRRRFYEYRPLAPPH